MRPCRVLSNIIKSVSGCPSRRQTGVAVLLVAALVLTACSSAPRQPRNTAPTGPTVSGSDSQRDKAIPPGATVGSQGQASTKFPGPQQPGATTPPAAEDGQPIKVGVLLPLSGPGSQVGPDLMDAASMALFDLGDKRLVLIPRDTRGTPEGAAAAATAVLSQGVELIIGPLLSSSVQAVTPLAQDANVPVIGFSSDRNAAAQGTYLLSFTPHQEIDRIVGYARQSGILTFAALLPDSDYGRAVEQGLFAALDRHGGELMQIEFYPASGVGVDEAVKRVARIGKRKSALARRRAELRQQGTAAAQRELRRLESEVALGELGLDAIILADGGLLLTQLAPYLQYYDVNLDRVRLLGTGLWYDRSILREPALKGGWFAAPDPVGFDNFAVRFKETYGKQPPRIASLAYDAAAIAAVLAQRPGSPKFSNEIFQQNGGFDGKDGVFRFRDDGNAERGLSVLEVRSDGFHVRDPAPRAFGDVGS